MQPTGAPRGSSSETCVAVCVRAFPLSALLRPRHTPCTYAVRAHATLHKTEHVMVGGASQRIYAAKNERRVLFLKEPTFEFEKARMHEGPGEQEDRAAEAEEDPALFEQFLLALHRAEQQPSQSEESSEDPLQLGAGEAPLALEDAPASAAAPEIDNVFADAPSTLPLVVVENPGAPAGFPGGRAGKLRPIRLRDGEKTPGVRGRIY